MTSGYSELKNAKIVGIRWDTQDTATIRISLLNEEDRRNYSFKPGQFNMLYVPGVGEAAISVSSTSEGSDVIEHTVRAAGYITRALLSLKEGDIIGFRGPYGNSWPVESIIGHNVLVIGGGIGVCPLRPAIYYLLKNRKKYSSVKILYGSRTPKDLMFPDEYDSWRDSGAEVHITVDRGDENWRENVGVVTTLLNRVEVKPENTSALVCGPEIMMKFTAIDLVMREIKPENIYLSMERRMKCGIGLCGHCQFGGFFVCRDGPVFTYKQVEKLLNVRGI
jgi:NAD(P)H-flavin reductase